MSEITRPGAPLAKRPLHFILMLDTSGSMYGAKIAALNQAVSEAIQAMKDAHEDNIFAEILVRAITFEDRAQWHVATPTKLQDFVWTPVSTGGLTSMGQALELAAKEFTVDKMGQRGFPPVLLLVSDGQPSDDFRAGLQKLTATPWGKRSIRVAIAIGDDADRDVLQEFMGNVELPVLTANNPAQLNAMIRFTSVAVTSGASSPASQTQTGALAQNLVVSAPPVVDDTSEVW